MATHSHRTKPRREAEPEAAAQPFPGDRFVIERVAQAEDRLKRGGVLTGARSARVSARIDPGLLERAKARVGLKNDSEVIAAALMLLAGQDTFGSRLLALEGSLPPDFELPI